MSNSIIIRLVSAIPILTFLSYFLFSYFFSSLGFTKLEIERENFYITYSLFGLKRKIFGATKDITKAKIGYSFLSGYSYDEVYYARSVVGKCFIVEGTKAKQFGRYIKRVEKEWLVSEANQFLDSLDN